MSNWWKYILVGAGCTLVTGAGGAGGMYVSYHSGYARGYEEKEPEIAILDYNEDGMEGMCVVKNATEIVCAADVNYDGAVDVALLDVETGQVKESFPGKEDCGSKYLHRNLERLLQDLEQPSK